MNEYGQNAINYLKTHLDCVGYRDYLVTELEKLDKIEQIVGDWKESVEWDIEMHDTLEEITKVLEQEYSHG